MPDTPTRDKDQTEAGSASHRASRSESVWFEGAIVGEHMLDLLLGRGGMGAVWSAVHLPTGARRAVKTLLSHLGSEERVRFQREGVAQARVDAHRNVVRVHASGVHHGTPWLAMDLVEGGDLATRLRGGPLDPLVAARLVGDLARGLAHVHRHGVLHRDLKPENVLFELDGTPRLTDFGVARLAGEAALTRTGELIGTPAYMSPEQARGQRADERADVWGLGAILYHALTGEPPFAGQTALAVLAQVATERPVPPRKRRPQVPAELEAVCLQALEPALERRLPSAEALARALDRFLDPPAAEAAPRLVPWALVAVAVLSLVAALGALVFRPGPEVASPSHAAAAGTASVPAPPASSVPPLSRPGELGKLLRRARAASPARRATMAELDSRRSPAGHAMGAVARWEGWDGEPEPLAAQDALELLLRRPADDPARQVAVHWLRHADAVGVKEARAILSRRGEPLATPLELDPRDLLGFDGSPVYDPGDASVNEAQRRLRHGDHKTPEAKRRAALGEDCSRCQSELGNAAWSGPEEGGRAEALRWYALAALDGKERVGHVRPYAWVRLGRAYLLGTGGCEADPEEGVRCVERALALGGIPELGREHGLQAALLQALTRLEGVGRPADPQGWADLGALLCEAQLASAPELAELQQMLGEAQGTPWVARAHATIGPALQRLREAKRPR